MLVLNLNDLRGHRNVPTLQTSGLRPSFDKLRTNGLVGGSRSCFDRLSTNGKGRTVYSCSKTFLTGVGIAAPNASPTSNQTLPGSAACNGLRAS